MSPPPPNSSEKGAVPASDGVRTHQEGLHCPLAFVPLSIRAMTFGRGHGSVPSHAHVS